MKQRSWFVTTPTAKAVGFSVHLPPVPRQYPRRLSPSPKFCVLQAVASCAPTGTFSLVGLSFPAFRTSRHYAQTDSAVGTQYLLRRQRISVGNPIDILMSKNFDTLIIPSFQKCAKQKNGEASFIPHLKKWVFSYDFISDICLFHRRGCWAVRLRVF